jgi:hypothetical protein
MGWLGKLLGTRPAPAGVSSDESIEALHAEFCRTFCHCPGVNFMDFLKAQGVTRMIDWLQPTSPCAIPKGFIRLAVDATRKGYKFWELPSISMNYEGNWSQGGLPPRESLDALSVLSQILGKSIKLYYSEREGSELMVKTFEP